VWLRACVCFNKCYNCTQMRCFKKKSHTKWQGLAPLHNGPDQGLCPTMFSNISMGRSAPLPSHIFLWILPESYIFPFSPLWLPLSQPYIISIHRHDTLSVSPSCLLCSIFLAASRLHQFVLIGDADECFCNTGSQCVCNSTKCGSCHIR
jgi:hypothetical protein